MPKLPNDLVYSDKYNDSNYEYRNVMLNREGFKIIKQYFDENKLLPEQVWRNQLKIQGSYGWQHYVWYPIEPYIILLRKKIK